MTTTFNYQQFSFRHLVIVIVSVLFLIPGVVATSEARGGHQGHGMSEGMPGDAPWKGMHKRMKKMIKALNLTEEQSKLHDQMHKTRRTFMETACQGENADGCRNSKLRKRAFHLFRAELLAENPDFLGAAAKIKSEYHGKYKAEFNAMIDAQAAFFNSLSAEQRDKLIAMNSRRGKHGKGMGPGGPK